MIAALYVAHDGPYIDLPGVEPWTIKRDARAYNGPHAVVAHPPCERWGKYWHGGPSARARRLRGDDGGCFDRALWAVRNFGGVLEHPAFSAAWRYYRICFPDPAGCWLQAGDGHGAWVCHVHQGHYGHPADKATWLYACAPRDALPELIWGPTVGKRRLDDGFHSKEERQAGRQAGRAKTGPRLTTAERICTPAPFREVLLQIAELGRSV